MSEFGDIYLVRSAITPYAEAGSAAEYNRPLEKEGHDQKQLLGENILTIVGGNIGEVRFAPSTRTRETALGVIALTYSSLPLEKEDALTNTNATELLEYLTQEHIYPFVGFTHLDVIQTAVKALSGIRPNESDLPTASVTKLVRSQEGITVEYYGMTAPQLLSQNL